MGIFTFTDKRTLYFPGCFSSAFLENKSENYIKILDKLGIKPRVIDNLACCGAILEEAGYEKVFRKLARENMAFFNDKKIASLIVSCPRCYCCFLNNYKSILPDWNIEVKFILEVILEKLETNPDFLKNVVLESVAYYDSCYLSRHVDFSIVPRVLLQILGYKIIDFENVPSEIMCCGSCGNLPITNKELSEQIAEDFLETIKSKGIKKLITADNLAHFHLNEILKKNNDLSIEIVHFSEVLCRALGIKFEKSEIKENENNKE